VNPGSPTSTHDLRPSERRFLAAMQQLGHGRFESLHIRHGELVLDPWPTTIRTVKFGNATTNRPAGLCGAFELKAETAQLCGFIRGVDDGEIRVLEVRGGLPFAMEVAETTVGVPSNQTSQGQNVRRTVDNSTEERLS